MSISKHSDTSVIHLTTEKELRTYMHPLRQKILQTLKLHPDGMTAKQIANRLSIAPSSAGHHLAALEQIGIIELTRTERIHGFLAKFYRVADVLISMADVKEDAQELRTTMFRHGVEQILQNHLQMIPGLPTDQADYFGICYLTEEEASQIFTMIQEFVESHTKPVPHAVPYEFALIAHSRKEPL